MCRLYSIVKQIRYLLRLGINIKIIIIFKTCETGKVGIRFVENGLK